MVRSLYTSAHMEEDIYITFYPVYGCQHIKGQFRVIFYSQFNGEVKSNTKICNFGSGGWIWTCFIWTEDLPSLFNSRASLTSLFFSFGFSFIMVTSIANKNVCFIINIYFLLLTALSIIITKVSFIVVDLSLLICLQWNQDILTWKTLFFLLFLCIILSEMVRCRVTVKYRVNY